MQKLKALNSKEKKELLNKIKEEFECELKTDYFFFINPKNKIYISSNEISKIDLSKLKIDSLGLYFGELAKGMLRLSIEGSQLIGPIAKKNIVEINPGEMRDWLKGNDLEIETDNQGFVILKYENDFLGCGKVKKEDSKTIILNHVPKARRILAED